MKFVLYLLSILLSGCRLYYNTFYTDPQKYFVTVCKNKPYDVIIVPGFPSDSGNINPILKERLEWAYYLYKNKYSKNIIFSGSAVYTPYVEAKVMRLYAIQMGILPEHILIEEKAEHTTENLYYGYKLAINSGFKKIGFASQAAHTSFMKHFPKKFKINVDMIPMITDSLKKLELNFGKLNPESTYQQDFVSIENRENVWKRMRGTRGKKVMREIRKEKRKKMKK